MIRVKFFLLAVFTGIFLAGCCTADKVPDGKLELTAKSVYQIVYADSAVNPGTVKLLKKTALQLQRAFRETLGAEFPVVPESAYRSADQGIFLGNTAKLRALGVNAANFRNYNYTVRENKGNIFIAGNDRHHFGRKAESAKHSAYIIGSAGAAIYFMERFLGTGFFYPGETGISYDRRERVTLPAGFRKDAVPQIRHGIGRNYGFFYSYAISHPAAGGLRSYGGHSYYAAVPAKKYGKSHPEYFALSGVHGSMKRNLIGNHLCISNPQVRELIYKELLRSLDRGAEVAELAQTDGYQPCLCSNCAKFGNGVDEAEKLWIIHHEMAERLMKDRPGKKVMIIAYAPTWEPPVTIKSFPPNTVIELCHTTPATFDKWKKLSVPGGFAVYLYNWGSYNTPGFTPKRTPEYVSDQVAYFRSNNVNTVYRCGFGENFGLEGPVYYVFGKRWEDPDTPVDDLLQRFYKGAFREVSGHMGQFYELLYDRLAVYSRLEAREERERDRNFKAPLPANPKVLLTMIYSPEVLEAMEKRLSTAEKGAVDPKVKKRLELVRLEFDYVKHLAAVLNMYNTYRTLPGKATLDMLLDAVGKRNKFIDSLFDGKKIRQISGWPELQVFEGARKSDLMTNGRSRGLIEAPLTWNVELLRKSGILPGVDRKKIVVKRASGKVEFNDFNSGAWKNAGWQSLAGIQLGKVSEQTRFKMLHDRKNLYVAVEAEMAPSRKHRALGSDAPVWRQDAMEMFFDPAGTRSSYYHLIYNPVAGSSYDAASGFITDPLHPQYGKADMSWNGTWKYLTRRKGNKWYSMVIIPFADFKVKAVPGMVWSANIGRDICLPNPKNRTLGATRELALWSPNLETQSFHDRETFGELVFE